MTECLTVRTLSGLDGLSESFVKREQCKSFSCGFLFGAQVNVELRGCFCLRERVHRRSMPVTDDEHLEMCYHWRCSRFLERSILRSGLSVPLAHQELGCCGAGKEWPGGVRSPERCHRSGQRDLFSDLQQSQHSFLHREPDVVPITV